MSYIWKVVIMSVCAYFVGNVTFARIVAKRMVGDDVTKRGSGNPGTTNMIRNYGAKIGFITFGLDALKGIVCSITAFFVCGGFDGGWQSSLAVYIVGLVTIVGHMFPVIFKFKGGKGVATGAGVAIVANPIATVVLVANHWLILYFVRKLPGGLMSLISVLLFTTVETICLCVRGFYWSLIPLYVIIILIFIAFRSNIKRIFEKKENGLDLKAAFEKDKEEKRRKKEEQKLLKNQAKNNTENNVENKA